MDNIPTGILKFVYFVMSLFTILTLGIFGYHWQTMSTYLASSQEVVSGYGGLTSEAQADLQDFSQRDYNNIFKVTPADSTAARPADYGQPIHYDLEADIPFMTNATINHQGGVHHLIYTKHISVTTYSNYGKDDDHG